LASNGGSTYRLLCCDRKKNDCFITGRTPGAPSAQLQPPGNLFVVFEDALNYRALEQQDAVPLSKLLLVGVCSLFTPFLCAISLENIHYGRLLYFSVSSLLSITFSLEK
jgi:hypothetical protein